MAQPAIDPHHRELRALAAGHDRAARLLGRLRRLVDVDDQRAGAARRARSGDTSHVWVLVVGCVLFVVVIGGLTYQLAQALGARNYSRKQDEFVSNITHEMKSPLAAIKLHAQTLQQPDMTGEELQRSVGLHPAAGRAHGHARRQRAREQPPDREAEAPDARAGAPAAVLRRLLPGAARPRRGPRRQAQGRRHHRRGRHGHRRGAAPRHDEPHRERRALLGARRRGPVPRQRRPQPGVASRSRTTASASRAARSRRSSTASTRSAARSRNVAAAPASACRSCSGSSRR